MHTRRPKGLTSKGRAVWNPHCSHVAGEWAKAVAMPLCTTYSETGQAVAIEKDGLY